MSPIEQALALIILVFVIEKAVLFHTKLCFSVALNDHKIVKDPPLFEPKWRIVIYVGYVVLGVAALSSDLQRAVAIAIVGLPILVLVVLDLIALRRRWKES